MFFSKTSLFLSLGLLSTSPVSNDYCKASESTQPSNETSFENNACVEDDEEKCSVEKRAE